MKYTYKFYLNKKLYKDYYFDDKDAKRAVSFWIARAIDELNYELTVKEAPERTALYGAYKSLISDSNKSKVLEKFYEQNAKLVLASIKHSIDIFFEQLRLFASNVGLVVVIEECKPQIVPSLASLAARNLIQHKHLYPEQIKKIPIRFFNAYPDLCVDSNDYMKARLRNLVMTHTQGKLESSVVLALSTKLKEPSADLYRSIHLVLTKNDFKNTFTAKMRAHLSTPLVALMNQHHKNEISDVDFVARVECVVKSYLSQDDELQLLLRLSDMAASSVNPASELHAYLKENKFSEKVRKTLRPMLIEIIADYKKFKRDKELSQVRCQPK